MVSIDLFDSEYFVSNIPINAVPVDFFDSTFMIGKILNKNSDQVSINSSRNQASIYSNH